MGANQFAASSGRVVTRMSAIAATLALCTIVASCGGRISRPVDERTDLDGELSCSHVISEKRSLKVRVADLRDERNANRRRSLTRLPSAVFSGNPFSALLFADPSTAIYNEISAAGKRQRVLDGLLLEKGCIEKPATRSAAAPAPKPQPVAIVQPASTPAGASAKVEPEKIELDEVEPAKVESAKVEPAKVEPAKVEPAKIAAKVESDDAASALIETGDGAQ